MNGSYSNNNNNPGFVVRLRGLPWNTLKGDIQSFLQGCKIRQTYFPMNNQSRPTGECFVVLESQEDVDNANMCHQKTIGSRYIEVFESSIDEMNQALKTNSSEPNNSEDSPNVNNENWRDPVVRLRGLPYNSSKEDVIGFFRGLDIAQNGVHISSSKPAGEAFVAFANMDNALRAMEFNRMNMGHRYIELFKSTYAEARASIMNDTQSTVRQRGGNNGPNQNYGAHRQGSFEGNPEGNGYNNHMNQYNGPPTNNYNSYGGNQSAQNYPMNNQMGGGGMKRAMSVSFTMKIRGVPFEAGEKEVFEFFSPVVPIRLEQENTPRGKPPIWYAEFGSREEATEALTYHKKFMGTRYIELLPLYDDLNRSKMART
ncbi:unnamed protein product [Adineta ricciae]|uniref:RRM domain-containing protein n=1 Tax=Adineta ricciae TaxID=249248 RepID=A0A813WXU4_ADIRI|nr:unnamed protein product [Adineta ricciae]CAF0878478.1 unnamed protein product [Adineta ricciae]